MLKNISQKIRTVSLISIIVLTGCDCVATRSFPGPVDLAINILVALFMFLVAPAPHEKQEIPFVSVIVTSIVLVLSAVFPFLGNSGSAHGAELVSVPGLMLAYMVVDLKARSNHKFANVNNLFRCVEVWNNVEDYSRHMRIIVFCILVALLEMSSATGAGTVSAVIMWTEVALVAVTYIRWMSMDCTSDIIGKANVNRVKAIVSGKFGGLKVQEKGSGENKMTVLYERVQKLMLEERPFLDETLKLGDMARMLYTNKSYLSKTINTMSGRNFNQYVNYFRVENAVELMSSDMRMKMSEVSSLSGFHNMVSFNSAFVLFKGVPPGEWLDGLKEGSRK